jgi:hypothetical protein
MTASYCCVITFVLIDMVSRELYRTQNHRAINSGDK